MNKTWLVIKHEYFKHVKKKRFILAVLSMPLFVIVILGVGLLTAALSYNDTPIGYIDRSGVLDNAIMPEFEAPVPFRDPLEIRPFNNEEEARSALDAEEIQAYYILPEDYLETGMIRAVANEVPDGDVNSQFRRFLRVNLLSGYSEPVANRILEGAEIEVQETEGERTMNDANILNILLPFAAGLLFMIAINTSGGYLLQAVVEEKENRTMEIIITSLSPTQLMTGKVIGNLSVGLTQLVIWILFGVLGVMGAMAVFPEIQGTRIDPTFFILMVLTFLPAFVMIAAMMATLGATATEAREAQQVAGLFTLPIVMPFWFIGILMESPNSPLSIAMSIFPFTAPISLPLRATFTNVPLWQSALTIGLLVLFAVGALWLAGRAFRMGMLRYGKRISLKELFAKPAEVKS